MPMSVHLLILMQLERWVEIKSTFHLTHTKLLWYWIPSKLKRPRWWIKNWQHEDIHGPYNELLKEKNQNFVIVYVAFVRRHYKTYIFWGFVLWQSMWHWNFKHKYSKYKNNKYISEIDDDRVLSRPKRLQKCL